jgi:hypothetical protein
MIVAATKEHWGSPLELRALTGTALLIDSNRNLLLALPPTLHVNVPTTTLQKK